MPIPDISSLTTAELAELSRLVALRHAETLADDRTLDEQRRAAIGEAIATLTTLLGPENATANLNNIRGVLQFTNEQMAANSGIAFRLIFQGMQILTETTLEVAKVLAR